MRLPYIAHLGYTGGPAGSRRPGALTAFAGTGGDRARQQTGSARVPYSGHQFPGGTMVSTQQRLATADCVVLVVDDDPVVLEGVRAILEHSDDAFVIKTARSRLEAIALVRSLGSGHVIDCDDRTVRCVLDADILLLRQHVCDLLRISHRQRSCGYS